MACPPEDSGGIFGYYQMLAIVKNKLHKDHLSYVEWLQEWDPEFNKNHFDFEGTNERLKNWRKIINGEE